MIKRIFGLLLLVFTCLFVVACGNGEQEPEASRPGLLSEESYQFGLRVLNHMDSFLRIDFGDFGVFLETTMELIENAEQIMEGIYEGNPDYDATFTITSMLANFTLLANTAVDFVIATNVSEDMMQEVEELFDDTFVVLVDLRNTVAERIGRPQIEWPYL